MAKFDVTYNMSEILNTPGIWIEQELDTITMIWEKNRARYMVPFSKDVAVDINDIANSIVPNKHYTTKTYIDYSINTMNKVSNINVTLALQEI